MVKTMPAAVVDQLVREMSGAFPGVVDEPTLRRTVTGALADLCGSVSAGSLPEMAARLARTRLTDWVGQVDLVPRP
jgi:hypothetical protein